MVVEAEAGLEVSGEEDQGFLREDFQEQEEALDPKGVHRLLDGALGVGACAHQGIFFEASLRREEVGVAIFHRGQDSPHNHNSLKNCKRSKRSPQLTFVVNNATKLSTRTR